MLNLIDIHAVEQMQNYLQHRGETMDSDTIIKVTKIIEQVKAYGDQAVLDYTKEFDRIELRELKVRDEEIAESAALADSYFVESMQEAKANIEFYHSAQKQHGYMLQKEQGIYMGQRVIPLDSVGIYVPGGRAQYPSSVLMNAIPARIAGVKRIVMITPPSKEGGIHPNIAAAARIAGVDEIYKLGGAQGIAALAYGTQSIKRVDKIVGPGNIFVAAAKKLVYGIVDIDMIAGPSEILVIADANANPCYIAADLLSQAEHDPLASAIFITTSQRLLDDVNDELIKQSAVLPKKAIIEQSLKNYGTAMVCDSIMEAIVIANAIAPEHLELMVEDAMEYLTYVKHAGSVFLGAYTCESIGDYYGGTNHVLPTNGTARFSSALGVDSFVKTSSFLHYSQAALQTHGERIMAMAKQEELAAHANAVNVRLTK